MEASLAFDGGKDAAGVSSPEGTDETSPSGKVAGEHDQLCEHDWRVARRGVLAFLRGRVADDKAEDIAQQSLVRLLLSLQARVPIRNAGAYLRQIALNLLRDHARSASRQPPGLDVDDACVGGSDLIASLEARDALRRLELALADLSPLSRDIFVAHRIDGLGHAEIAARTGLTRKAVERRMSKAIAHIDRVAGSWR